MDDRAVLTPTPDIGRSSAPMLPHLLFKRLEIGIVALRAKIARRTPYDLGGAVAVELLRAGVPALNRKLGAQRINGLRNQFDNRLVAQP